MPQPLCQTGQHGLPAHVVICRQCGLVYLHPRWTRERYDRFYRKEYESYYRPETDPLVVEKQKSLLVLNRLRQYDPLAVFSRILDVGCGYGGLLATLADHGHGRKICAAIEPSATCQRHLNKDSRIQIIGDNIEQSWPDNDGPFNLIILRHVLEHLADPAACLKKISENLSEDGLLYLAVPDMMNAKGSLEKYWFRAVHTFYFSRATLEHVCRTAGLSVLLIRSEKHEIWGILGKAYEATGEPPRVYREQMNYINNYKQDSVLKRIIKRISKI